MALRAIPATHKKVRTELLVELLRATRPGVRVEVLRALKDRAARTASIRGSLARYGTRHSRPPCGHKLLSPLRRRANRISATLSH